MRMMINKRLIHTVKESKTYIAGNVICQWISLAANITMMGAIAGMLRNLFEGSAHGTQIAVTAAVAAAAVAIRFACAVMSSRLGYLSARAVKKTLREMIYRKLLRLGSSYQEQANTSEVVQVAVEGVILATTQFRAGHVDLAGCILIILLAADFFLPMGLLGSFFHIAMNGMAASDKIFRLLDLPEPEQKTQTLPEDCAIECKGLRFSYDTDQEILHGLDMTFPKGSFTSIVGESGCGKSTISAIFMGRNKGYSGQITVGGVPLREISEESLMENFTSFP